jgi:hypothetical protein
MTFARIAVCAAVSVIATGCAAVDVQRVQSYNQPGIRYWRPAPYIALQPAANNATKCEAKIVMLPDKSEEYAITVNTGLWGSASANPTLQDGWNLTGLDAKADSKTADVLASFASFVKAVAPNGLYGPDAGGKMTKRQVRYTPQCDGLYHVLFDEVTGGIRGFEEVRLPVRYAISPVPAAGAKKGDNPSR